MHLEQVEGELRFVADPSDQKAENDFRERMTHYKLIQHGASVFIYQRQNDRLLSHYNPYDNTQLVLSPEGIEVANEFGAKRFLALTARQAGSAETKAEYYPRDRSFPLTIVPEASTESPYRIVTLEDLLELFQQNKDELYETLADLFDRCADFIPEKQAEYKSGGRTQDKFCRFNMEDLEPRSGVQAKQLFMLDENNHIVGTISWTLCASQLRPEELADFHQAFKQVRVDIYLKDEVVNYFTQTQPDSELMKRVQALEQDNALTTEQKKEEITKLTEPLRLKLMAPLFAAARRQLRQTLLELYPEATASELSEKINKGEIRAFIRAADKRVSSYQDLGCSKENTAFAVIHGRPTPAAKLLDSYIKEVWAKTQLQNLRRIPTQDLSIDAKKRKVTLTQTNTHANFYPPVQEPGSAPAAAVQTVVQQNHQGQTVQRPVSPR